MRHPGTVAVVTAVTLALTAAHARTEVSWNDRLTGQRALERVAWAHRLGQKPEFETSVPEGVIEAKVRRYLQESVALEKIWGDTITAHRLSQELARMVAGSRLPRRLQELFDALGNDSVLLQECLARPALVDRDIRSRYAWDPVLHAATRARADAAATLGGHVVERDDAFVVGPPAGDATALSGVLTIPKTPFDSWWASRAADFDPSEAQTVADPSIVVAFPAVAAGADACGPDDSWDGGMSSAGPPPRRQEHVAVWTGTEMIVWGGVSDQGAMFNYKDGARYDPATDTWSSMATPALSPRDGAAGVWTGSAMIVWGGGIRVGIDSWQMYSDGATYDPVSNSWASIVSAGAPSARVYAAAVWTGSGMLVFGGQQWDFTFHTLVPVRDGSRYDPAANSWNAMAATPLTKGPYKTTAWVSGRMWFWDQAQGAGYDPSLNSWTVMTGSGAPSNRTLALVAATDHEVAVWGGSLATVLNDGALYDPALDRWRPMSAVAAPPGRRSPLAAWTGRELFVWGGVDTSGNPVWSGGQYDPVADAWRPAETRGGPVPRKTFTMVWTGSEAIVWGGTDPEFPDAKRYDPATRRWSPVSAGAPISRANRGNVWTGSELIVLGGDRYDPITDAWAPIATFGMPIESAPAVWTGSLVVAWGGGQFVQHAGRYDPVANVWSAMSKVGEPTARTGHTLTWTGSKVVAWGGFDTALTNTGGRYDPASDSWAATSAASAPLPRTGATAVWSGSRVLIWGGSGTSPTLFGDGASYDPFADTWTALPPASAPSPRNGHTAVWSGQSMIVWGGFDGTNLLTTGARFTPSTNSWAATSTLTAPTARLNHAATWTGHVMLVWGGQIAGGTSNTGGRYDPGADSWAAMNTLGAPAPRSGHLMVWTGSLALVWGGGPAGGGRYVLGHGADDDGDGFSECQGDCNDGDASVWFVPSEVGGLSFGADKATLTWAPATSGSVAAPKYTLFRSPRADLFLAANCVATQVAATTATDSEAPATGQAFYYLVGAADSCTRSTLDGSWSDGTPRTATCGP